MKSRTGFVSNSSSSSFLLRGIKISEEELNKLLGTDIEDEGEAYWEFGEVLHKKGVDLDTNETRYYFGGDPTHEILIGESLEDPDDGCVIEIKDNPEIDEKIRNELAKIGIKEPTLSTFFQYISNDNY